MWYMHEGWGWWMVFGGIWMLVFWVAIIALVVWGIKQLTGHKEPGGSTPEKRDPLEIAKEPMPKVRSPRKSSSR